MIYDSIDMSLYDLICLSFSKSGRRAHTSRLRDGLQALELVPAAPVPEMQVAVVSAGDELRRALLPFSNRAACTITSFQALNLIYNNYTYIMSAIFDNILALT